MGVVPKSRGKIRINKLAVRETSDVHESKNDNEDHDDDGNEEEEEEEEDDDDDHDDDDDDDGDDDDDDDDDVADDDDDDEKAEGNHWTEADKWRKLSMRMRMVLVMTVGTMTAMMKSLNMRITRWRATIGLVRWEHPFV